MLKKIMAIEDELYQQVVNKFGHDLQINQAIQEMAELTKELTKIKHGKYKFNNLIEELIDVEIMIKQVKHIIIDMCLIDGYLEVVEFNACYENNFNRKLNHLKELIKDGK